MRIALLALSLLIAQSPANETKKQVNKPAKGRVTALSPNGFDLHVPQGPRIPVPLRVAVDAQTQILWLKRGHLRDLKEGDMVAVSVLPGADSQPAAAVSLVRLAPGDGDLTEEAQRQARRLAALLPNPPGAAAAAKDEERKRTQANGRRPEGTRERTKGRKDEPPAGQPPLVDPLRGYPLVTAPPSAADRPPGTTLTPTPPQPASGQNRARQQAVRNRGTRGSGSSKIQNPKSKIELGRLVSVRPFTIAPPSGEPVEIATTEHTLVALASPTTLKDLKIGDGLAVLGAAPLAQEPGQPAATVARLVVKNPSASRTAKARQEKAAQKIRRRQRKER